MNEDVKPPADSFEDAERFKRLFLDPSIELMSEKMKGHLAPIVQGQRKLFAQIEQQQRRDQEQDARLDKLEGSNKKAMVGWGVFATGLSVLLSASWAWIASKLKIGGK